MFILIVVKLLNISSSMFMDYVIKKTFFIIVLQVLGVSSDQLAIDLMDKMSQEFVTEQENETELNKEIDDLLNGIDFQQSISQEVTCIPSSFPEENEISSDKKVCTL